MNQYSEEIKADLNVMMKRYGITKGFMAFEETNVDTGAIQNRVVLFQAKKKNFFSMCEFADLFQACLQVSETFRELIKHLSLHSTMDSLIMEQHRASGKKSN